MKHRCTQERAEPDEKRGPNGVNGSKRGKRPHCCASPFRNTVSPLLCHLRCCSSKVCELLLGTLFLSDVHTRRRSQRKQITLKRTRIQRLGGSMPPIWRRRAALVMETLPLRSGTQMLTMSKSPQLELPCVYSKAPFLNTGKRCPFLAPKNSSFTEPRGRLTHTPVWPGVT